MPIVLPTELSKPKTKLSDLVFYFYGRPKIGKTSLALRFPQALLLAFEPGAKTQECYQIPIKNWAEFRETVALLKKDKRFETVVLDTADLAFAYCDKFCCAELGVTDRADANWGKGWNAVKKEFTTQILALANTGRGIVFTSHQAQEPYKDHNGKDKTRIVPSLRDKGAYIMGCIVDVWAPLLDAEGGKRLLQVRGNEFVEAGQRLNPDVFKHFCSLTSIDLGNSAAEAYSALHNALFPQQAQETK